MSNSSQQPLISAHGLGFGYPGKSVGRGIDIEVHAGEIVCLLGPNGSGKTTLFKTLLGLIPMQAGQVKIAGTPLDAMSRQGMARAMAYVPQAHAAHFPYRVIDMVVMGRTAHLGLFAAPSELDRTKARDALALLGIGDLAEQPYTRISGGQRQMALIARALAQEAHLIVMDEPTASLDFGNQVKVLSQVRQLAARGLGIILSTHAPDQAFATASRVLLLHDAGLIADGAPADVLTAEKLRMVYGVDVAIETIAGGHRVCVPEYAD